MLNWEPRSRATATRTGSGARRVVVLTWNDRARSWSLTACARQRARSDLHPGRKHPNPARSDEMDLEVGGRRRPVGSVATRRRLGRPAGSVDKSGRTTRSRAERRVPRSNSPGCGEQRPLIETVTPSPAASARRTTSVDGSGRAIGTLRPSAVTLLTVSRAPFVTRAGMFGRSRKTSESCDLGPEGDPERPRGPCRPVRDADAQNVLRPV